MFALCECTVPMWFCGEIKHICTSERPTFPIYLHKILNDNFFEIFYCHWLHTMRPNPLAKSFWHLWLSTGMVSHPFIRTFSRRMATITPSSKTIDIYGFRMMQWNVFDYICGLSNANSLYSKPQWLIHWIYSTTGRSKFGSAIWTWLPIVFLRSIHFRTKYGFCAAMLFYQLQHILRVHT